MASVSESVRCDDHDCPVLRGQEIAAAGGEEAERHYLRCQVVELRNRLGRAVSRLRALGEDVTALCDHAPHTSDTLQLIALSRKIEDDHG